MPFVIPKRVWPKANVPSGGGVVGGAPEYTRLTPAMLTDGRTFGGFDGYAASNLTLTDDGDFTTVTVDANVALGTGVCNQTRRFSVFWHDTGIKIKDLSAIEVMLQHVGKVGDPNTSSRKPVYGFICGTNYFTGARDTWYSAPEHFASIANDFQSNGTLFTNTMVDDEGMSASGLQSSWAHASYGYIPVYEQAVAGGNPGGEIRLTVRDLLARRLADGGGGVGDGVPASARDVSTWWGSGRYWTQEQTLKVGILIGNKVSGKSYTAGEGWQFKVFYKPVKNRLVGRI